MEEKSLFSIVTSISEEQKTQLYALLEKFEIECDEKNSDSNLPAKIEKKNIVQKLLSEFRKIFIKLRKQENTKNIANDILNGKKENSRLFMLCQGDRVVGFEMAQISKEKNNRIVGWKPWMYIQKEFRNSNQKFIDEQGKEKNKNVTLQLDRYVENWFEENDVNYQKTSTGINMLPNIVTYIGLGFKPVSKNENNVFFEKDMEHPLSKEEIKNLIRDAKKGKICTKEGTFRQRVKSDLSLEEQKNNSEKFEKINDINTLHENQTGERNSRNKNEGTVH